MARRRKFFVIAVIVLVGLIGCCFLFRGHVLRWAFTKAQTRIHESYRAALTVSDMELSGLNHILLRGITLQPDGADTFLQVGEVQAHLSLASLCRGRIVFDRIRVSGAAFTIYNEEGRNNLSFLRQVGRHKDPADTYAPAGYRDRAIDWEAKLFRLLGTAFEATDIRILYQDSAVTESVSIPTFSYDLRQLSGMVINQKNGDTIAVSGTVLRPEEEYAFTIRQFGADSAWLPFLDRTHSLQCRFHSITADIRFDRSGEACTISTEASLENFHINHWRLAREDVVLPHAQFSGKFRFTDEAVEMDSASVVTLGGLGCHVFARYEVRPDTAFALAVHMPETGADSSFRSLPGGMFSTLKGISCIGMLTYDLNFAIHTDSPDSLVFYSALRQKNLHIQHFGAEDYARINGPFVYEAYDKDKLVRRLMVGPDNPFFTTLDQMPAWLPQAVLQAEDPGFMQHRGFLPDAFRESIAQNYKEKRFARGGSTISMQLVKNVFLSRDKTISRKAEEALIVYLIENLGLVPKARMLEVYLNVIEWGPGVYGIGEAASFYFSKRPSQLTLQESLFLASIIPRPKSFQWQFDGTGQLRASMGSYFRILTERMVWRGVLSPADTVGLEPKVTLKGYALHLVSPKDSIPEEEEE